MPELDLQDLVQDPIDGWSGASRTAGYVFRAKYDYDNKYLAEFTGRYDGSYKFMVWESVGVFSHLHPWLEAISGEVHAQSYFH